MTMTSTINCAGGGLIGLGDAFHITCSIIIIRDLCLICLNQLNGMNHHLLLNKSTGEDQGITNLVMLQVVDDREDATLVPIIHRHSVLGATIITDAFASYNPLNSFGFHHWSLNHSRTFADPLTGWHSNTIEGIFGLCKFDLKKHKGIPQTHVQRHLDAWCFKRNTIKSGQNYWEQLVLVIGAMQEFVDGP